MNIQVASFGYPTIGAQREFKKIVESYWKNRISEDDLHQQLLQLHCQRLKTQQQCDFIPLADFTYYDAMLDQSVLFGAIPQRFQTIDNPIDQYFAMARGVQNAPASEMTKWFNTNYHYIVPELGDFQPFQDHFLPHKMIQVSSDVLGNKGVHSLIGPYTYLRLSKIVSQGQVLEESPVLNLTLRDEIVARTVQLIQAYSQTTPHQRFFIHEPAFCFDLSLDDVDIILSLYKDISQQLSNQQLFVLSYYDALSQYEHLVSNLPVAGIGLDFVSNTENLDNLMKFGLPKDKTLVAGLAHARQPWKMDLHQSYTTLKTIEQNLQLESVVIAPAAPLQHLPHTVQQEKDHLPKELLPMLSFADERLIELRTLADLYNAQQEPQKNTVFSPINPNPEQALRAAQISQENIQRPSSFEERISQQQEKLQLPALPSTTIGSFPQSPEIRSMRRKFRSNRISATEYRDFLHKEFDHWVQRQEELELDVFVHGEAERTDMVEFFGEKLSGFAFSSHGWVRSYGSRCVRPPIIYSDVTRPNPMTLDETLYAQSKTSKPMKGMLTGPVTIVNWSFYREDIPKEQVAYQIALALADEVYDLEKSGIAVIQIDEPAFREGLPLKKNDQQAYLDWAVKAFRTTHYQVQDSTQIHTHMCYSEFNAIIQAIFDMDADVISIETSRSYGEILQIFKDFDYRKGIGLGTYDIHSPRIPSVEEIEHILEQCAQLIDPKLIWVNPDCGLKTRTEEETLPALKNMVTAAHNVRKKTFLMSNTFGRLFRFTTWGESHGPAIGCVIDGCPAGLELCEDDIMIDMNRRKPGKNIYTTQRKEPDQVQILSGVFEGKTTGTPISIIVHNQDSRSKDYNSIKDVFRPSHADCTYFQKYGLRDYRGGGRASARETAMRVAAGAIAKKILSQLDIDIYGYLTALGSHTISPDTIDFGFLKESPLFCPDPAIEPTWKSALEEVRSQGDSLPAEIEIVAERVPPGLGEPIYGKLDALLASALMSINAVKSVEIGLGKAFLQHTGSSCSDQMQVSDEHNFSFLSNHSGGSLGGISSGQPIVTRFTVKPTSSIRIPKQTVTKEFQNTSVTTLGRHDPCVGIRAVPIGEAMVACVLVDLLLQSYGNKLSNLLF